MQTQQLAYRPQRQGTSPATESSSPEEAMQQRMLETIRNIKKAFIDKKMALHYSIDECKSLGFDWCTLDLTAPTQYVRPIPLDKMKAWLEEKQPWDDGFIKHRYCGGGWVERQDHAEWWNAQYTYGALVSHVIYGGEYNGGPGVMHTHTRWASRVEHPIMKEYGRVWYAVRHILEYEVEGVLHTSATLIQDIELREDALTICEMFAIEGLVYMRIMDGALKISPVLPVTLVSIGGCSIRILHGSFDLKTGRMAVQISRIMVFDKQDDFKNKEDFKRIMCWMLAEPIIEGQE